MRGCLLVIAVAVAAPALAQEGGGAPEIPDEKSFRPPPGTELPPEINQQERVPADIPHHELPDTRIFDAERLLAGKEVKFAKGSVDFRRGGQHFHWKLRHGSMIPVAPNVAVATLEYAPDKESPQRLELSVMKIPGRPKIISIQVDMDQMGAGSFPSVSDEKDAKSAPDRCPLKIDQLDARGAKGQVRCDGGKGWEGVAVDEALFEALPRR